VLVITEGLLAYLDEDHVAALADDLRSSLPDSLWILENISPAILARMQRNWGKSLHPANAAMKFAPKNGLDFYRRHGWRPRSTKSLLDEAQRLGREMALVSVVRRLSSVFRPLGRAYAKRQAQFRDSVVYALMEPVSAMVS
jgi:O-methyltransferase involved in polyketide biosynthesis